MGCSVSSLTRCLSHPLHGTWPSRNAGPAKKLAWTPFYVVRGRTVAPKRIISLPREMSNPGVPARNLRWFFAGAGRAREVDLGFGAKKRSALGKVLTAEVEDFPLYTFGVGGCAGILKTTPTILVLPPTFFCAHSISRPPRLRLY